MAIFKDKDVCLGGILSVEEALNSENTKTRHMVISKESSGKTKDQYLGIPVKLSESPGTLRTPSPKFGQDTRRILNELGYSQKEIEQFEIDEVI